MNYGLIYTIPFATLDNTPCVVEIEKDNYSGSVQELTPGENPFTVDITDEEFLYTPTRFSTATIHIVGNDYLQSLFSIAYQQYRVTFKKNGTVTWCGFIKPELYTQDYSSTIFELQLECMSAMSTLEFIDYKQVGENRVFISLWDLLKKCISSANSQYTNIYIPHVYAQNAEDYVAGTNILESMTVSEQDFFDEDDKPMKLKEVLEEICKFLNWTCIDWRGELYFVDIDHIGEFYKYNPVTFEKVGTSSPSLLNIQNIGFAGSEHTLDILPGYNKTTIRCSNYPISGSLFEEIDFDKSEVIASTTQYNAQFNPTQAFKKKYLLNQSVDLKLYKDGDGRMIEANPKDFINNPNGLNYLYGARLVKTCQYNPRDSELSEYTYDNSIQIRIKDLSNISVVDNELIILSFANKDYKVFPKGVFCISGSVMPFYQDQEMSFLNQEDTSLDSIIFISLRIGDKYYNGLGWVPVKTYITVSNLGGSGFRNLRNTKTPDMPYKGLKGFIIPVDSTLIGDIELSILMKKAGENGRPHISSCLGYYLKDFDIVYQKPDNISDDEDNNSDRIYENIVNENFINELDEIEFKISSYNNDGACYSKVMLGDQYLTDNLYSAIEETAIRPEEQLIRRIVKRYSSPHIKLTQVIKAIPDLTPISRLYDNYMVNKRFINVGGSINFKMNRFSCIMIEV